MRTIDTLYPPIDALETGRLRVSELHEIYWERSGNPEGKPVVVIHGGPGGGSQPEYRSYFDSDRYHIIQLDQRGCGQSTPHAELRENDTPSLVSDIETLREHLNIEEWQVFGGSWGSTLALIYAEQHPKRVTELVLRGIFMCRPKELRWFYQHGASEIFPDAFTPYRDHIPEAERENLIAAYYQRLTSEDPSIRLAAAKCWTAWEMATSRLIPDDQYLAKADDAPFAEAFARIECHYFVNHIFMPPDTILANIDAIRHIPGIIVQGRYDVVCPPVSAWELHRAWPESELTIVADAGHSVGEPGIAAALVAATDEFAES